MCGHYAVAAQGKVPLRQVFDPPLAHLTFGDDIPLIYRNVL
jgi:hypothetical protein